MNVFIIGRPGSGKSTAARELTQTAESNGLSTTRLDDYPILKSMFEEDTHHLKFQPTQEGGFNAIDLSVMDDALLRLEQQAMQQLTAGRDLVTLEFARTEYREAFQWFSSDFLRESHVLFLDADIETCLARVQVRIASPQSGDDHPSFPDEKFRYYYGFDNCEYMRHGFQDDFHPKSYTFLNTEIISHERFRKDIQELAQDLIYSHHGEPEQLPYPLGLPHERRYF